MKAGQFAAAMGRASNVQFEYVKTEPDGTLVFKAWTREDRYEVTFSPTKPGFRICKHVMKCASHIVGDWLADAQDEIRKEQLECREMEREYKKAGRELARLRKKLAKASVTSSKNGGLTATS